SRMIRERGVMGLSSSQVLKMLQTSDMQINRLIKLIDDMLDVSRMKVGHFELVLEEFDLNETVRRVADLYAQGKDAFSSSITVKGLRPLMVRLDQQRVEQVLTNFIKNAMVYGKGNPITIRSGKIGNRVFFSVSDRGIGIP